MMPDPTSHAEMIAAVTRWTDRLEQWANLTDKSEETRAGHLAELEKMRAVLRLLERTQPTDTQADLTERAPLDVKLRAAQQARSVLHPFRQSHHLLTNTQWEDLQTAIAKAIAASAQSEREAAAAEARRAAITECAKRARGVGDHADCQHEPGYMDGRLGAAADILVLASPAPQEETR